MIIVTGGAGFIGSALVWKINTSGRKDIVVVDRLGHGPKWQNLAKRQIQLILHKDQFLDWLTSPDARRQKIEAIFHLGACSATTETDADYLVRNNVHYSMALFRYCTEHDIPFFYASSAATYGGGEKGFRDDPQDLPFLRPINPYGYSKQLFDHWLLAEKEKPPFWQGFKFFNVYGPQEFHKGPQASVAYHAYGQVTATKVLKLFKSYRPEIAHGDQKRDFIYIKDVVDVLWHCFTQRHRGISGIYNLGSGKARTFADLGRAIFEAMNAGPERFDWIEMPDNIRHQYQYFTEADMARLRTATHYERPFTSLDEGVRDYVQNYLQKPDSFL